MGTVRAFYWQWLSKKNNNMTFGIHSQEYNSDRGKNITIIFLGLFFIRLVLEFEK